MIGPSAFLRCIGRSLFPRKDDPVRLSAFRLLATFVLTPMCVVLWAGHYIGFLFDEIFFRGYRQVRVTKPLFVVGPPRSGTTFLHRALARDKATFTSFTLGEMVFAPSITEKKLWSILALLDRALGAPVSRRIKKAEARGLADLNEMHWVSFFEPEEDYVLLAYLFANQLLIAMFPFPDLLGHLWRFDEATPHATRRRVLRFYEQCVQRHLYHHGEDKVFLSKNPYFTPMIRSLHEHFPDARFVCNVREPSESLPSMLALWKVFYGSFKNNPDHYLARDFVVDYMVDFYERVDHAMETLPSNHIVTVPYPALIKNTHATVRSLYKDLGYHFSEAFDEQLAEESSRTDIHKSKRRYVVADFDLEPESTLARFQSVWDKLNAPTRETAS